MEENEVEEDIEVEVENNDNVIIDVPFNPNKIKVKSLPYSIGQIIQDLGEGIINLDTEFQRLPNLWDISKQSQFIESLILNLPIPSFYFNEADENTWEVIDGLQRISTLKKFIIERSFALKNLEFLKEFEGFRYNDLPNPLSKRITRFAITIYVIERETPIAVKYNIFKRVNTGGLKLEAQEIRHAINQGLPAELIADLARGSNSLLENGHLRTRKNSDGNIIELRFTEEGVAFTQATDGKIATKRMEDRDFINRFIAFYLIPYQEYNPDLDSFLSRGMSKIKDLDNSQINELKYNFKASMRLAFDIFGQDAFRKRHNELDKRKPINKALFEVLSVNFAKLDDRERGVLNIREAIFKGKLMELNNNPDGKFLRSISQGTAQKDSVVQRFTDIQRIIRETIENDNSITSN